MMSRRRGSPPRFNHHVVGLRNLDMEIERARLIAFRLAEDEKNLHDGEKRLLNYKNESMARRKKEIDEELRMLEDSDKRKRDELMAELKKLRLELDSPLERTPASSSSTPISTTPDSELLETEMTTPVGADRKEDFRPFPPWTAPWNPEISRKLHTLLEIRGRYLQDNRLEPYFGNFWELACYPMRSKIFTNKARVESLVSDLKPLLESAIPNYPNDLKDVVSGSQLPDIVSLLSPTPGGGSLLLRNHGDEEVVLDGNTFRDKYVLICCFHVPVLWTSCHFQGLVNLCEELYSTQDDFEMVMVARMNTLADTEAVFDYFFKGMPSSCLAVPYKDFKRREHICKLLGLDPSSLIYKSIECRFVNPDGIVVRNPFILSKYGADAYPFAKADMKAIVEDRKEMIYGAKLTQLLKPVDDKDVVCHCYPGGDLQELLGVTEGKHVGLYMCAVGSLIPVLCQVHDECRQNNCNFEIVVLYCPSYDALDPSLHREKMHRKFQMHNVGGWWCLPFNNSVSLRFCEITRFYNTGCWHPADKLIIFGPEGKILDVYGAEVIKYLIRSGIGARVIKSHPFTREAHVNGLKSELQEITLDSLLSSPLRSKTAVITVGELLNCKRKIIIFMDCLRNLYFENFLYLKDSYIKLKKEHGDAFEVVFFDSSEKTDPATREDYEWAVQEMPWYVYPVDGTRSLSFLKLTETLVRRALFGFGVDGKLCSYESICTNQVDFRLTSDTTLFEDIRGHFGYTNFAKP
ncbi:hypothetical protein OROGR_021137 [Orobanche gracilis]